MQSNLMSNLLPTIQILLRIRSLSLSSNRSRIQQVSTNKPTNQRFEWNVKVAPTQVPGDSLTKCQSISAHTLTHTLSLTILSDYSQSQSQVVVDRQSYLMGQPFRQLLSTVRQTNRLRDRTIDCPTVWTNRPKNCWGC